MKIELFNLLQFITMIAKLETKPGVFFLETFQFSKGSLASHNPMNHVCPTLVMLKYKADGNTSSCVYPRVKS